MFGKTPRKIGEFVLKYRWPIIIANFLILALLIMAMGKRAGEFQAHTEYMEKVRNNPLDANPDHVSPPPIFDADYHVWFPEDNPELIAYDNFQDVFSKEENMIIVAIAKNGDIFTNENLASLMYLTNQSWSAPYVSRVDGLTNFNYTYVEDDDLLVEDFVVELPLSDAEIAEKKRLALSDPLMPNFLVSKKGDVSQIQLRVTIPKDFPTGYLDVREAIENLVQQIEAEKIPDENGNMIANPNYNPNLELRLSGVVMLNTAFQKFAQDDVENLIPIMFLLIMLILLFSIRAFWGTVAPLVLLLTSVLFPLTLFVGIFNFSLNNASTNMVQMLVAVAIADSVHVLAIFYRGLRNGLGKRDAVIYTVEKNFLPCLITSITTAIGFYSLFFQNIPPFTELGFFSGTGTLYAFFASLFTLPAFLSLMPFKKRETDKAAIKKHENSGYERLTNFVVTYQKPIRWFTLASSIFALYFATQIKLDNTPIKYFAKGTEFREASEYIDNNIIGVNPLEFQFDSGEDNGIYDPAYLKKIERFQEYIATHPEYEITYVSGITDIVKRINKTMNGDDPAYYRIPEENEVTAEGDTINAKKLIAQYLLLYQLSLPQGMELTNQIDIRNRTTRVTAYVKSISSYTLLEHAANIENWIQENIPSVNTVTMGVPIMFGRLFTLAIPSVLKSLLIAVFLITIVLTITFRSIRIGLFSMIPNLWPLVFVFGIIGFLGIDVTMSVAIVGMITLGIAVDDTVHFLTKYLRGKNDGLDQRHAIQYALRQVAAPLFFTSVILTAGFGSLIVSDFALNADLGLYSMMIIVFALVADFILLPAVILKFDKAEETNRNTKMEMPGEVAPQVD